MKSERNWCVGVFSDLGLSVDASVQLYELLEAFPLLGVIHSADLADQIHRFKRRCEGVPRFQKQESDVPGQQKLFAPNGAPARWD